MRSSSGSQASRIREAAKPHAGGKNGRAKSSTNARVREIAETVLADGRVHERREIGAAVKAAGLPPTAVIGALRNRYQEGHNVDGRPTYCDASVASPYLDPREVADADKPNWMRNHGAAHEPGDAETIAAANGGPK